MGNGSGLQIAAFARNSCRALPLLLPRSRSLDPELTSVSELHFVCPFLHVRTILDTSIIRGITCHDRFLVDLFASHKSQVNNLLNDIASASKFVAGLKFEHVSLDF